MATYSGTAAPVEFRPSTPTATGYNVPLAPQCGGGTMVYNLTVDVTIAEINALHVLVATPVNRQFRLVNVTAIAYGGAVTGLTTLDLTCGANTLVSYAQANLTQSLPLRIGDGGVTILADGASFTAQTADNDLIVTKTGGSAATATGVRFILEYALD